ncbi:hypothetical protein Q7C_196 [Methylophaga frappieri]|uniref:Uncharacterized protein n=1 Tax=Methylophaga frappieri (strain ATCC BAA-2434 / DSM 25690 / JAM7) TaxID=754477 RepID=I1YEN4_METFJ|nr:hypothetical protein [Methylophaga frappieri]AFJ01377.1 hypothetical protein Q7C_196 [Methylophaga frappieri]
MKALTPFGMFLVFILAVVGGYMTGLFARLLYELAAQRMRRTLAIALNAVFFVVPIWALFRIVNNEGQLWFYLLLLLFYFLGLRETVLASPTTDRPDRNYDIDDD